MNRILVSIDNKYQDEKTTESGFKYYQDTSFNPEHHVTVSGIVQAVPTRLTDDQQTIVPEVQIGDELIFKYRVIFDKELRPDVQAFKEDSDQKAINKIFTNGEGQRVRVQHFSRTDCVVYWTNRDGDLLGGYQGTPKECDRFLAKNFKFATEEDFYYCNLLIHDDRELWMVDYRYVMAVKRNGELIMIGGNVLMEKQEVRHVYERRQGMHLDLVAKIDVGVSTVIAIGTPKIGEPKLNVNAGDKVRFNQRFVQSYELWGKEYLVLDQDRILGIQK